MNGAIQNGRRMAKSTKTILNEVMKQGFLPALVADGFEKSPVRHPDSFVQYHRSCVDGYQLVDVQKDKWWTKESGKFTINLGLYFPKLEAILYNPTFDEMLGDCRAADPIPHAGYWTFQERLGVLTSGKDEWFEIRNLPPPPGVVANTDVDQLSHRLIAAWREFGKPWLDKRGEISNWLRSRKRPAVLLLMGERDKALLALIDELILHKRGGIDPEFRLSWAKYRGLLSESEAARIAEIWHSPTNDFGIAIKKEILGLKK